ncbi:carbohydrate ABC transporter permease [Ruania halotolerans]|uniref:carbohydrate ABC transporter permease n=1 Tax=Ruania halotolerans TaxID=2897773 RepID=UPI001E3F55FB|nr:carbohydrate ABC transporter permease [Ruania halotolerans]UFU07595.1 carbohydrate ABC transporter permease [Ruania halotolerans]
MTAMLTRPGTEGRRASEPTLRRRRSSIRPGTILVAAVLAFGTVVPFLAVFILALSPEGARTIPFQLPQEWTLDNLIAVLSARNFLRWTANTAIYSIVSVVLVLITAAMAGYAFAKKRFPGREIVFWSFLATLMVPTQATIIPLFVLVAKLEGIDTFWGLIVPTLANSQAVFLMRQFIMGLPDELFEAAKIDGAREWTIFWRIVLPLTTPILATLGIFVFLWHWNDFLWPLIIAQTDEMRTLTVGLASLNQEAVSQARLMAAAAITVIPCLLVFAVLQRYIVNSVAASGIKG